MPILSVILIISQAEKIGRGENGNEPTLVEVEIVARSLQATNSREK